MSCLQHDLREKEEMEESYQRIQKAKTAALPELIQIQNDFIDGKINLLEAMKHGYFAILKKEAELLEDELEKNKNRPEVKAFFEKIRKENKNGSTTICK